MSQAEMSLIQEKISFLSDNFNLQGILHLPKDIESPAVVIGSHGLFSTKDSPKQIALAQACNAQGIAFFRFDHRGCGDSEGDFKEVTSFIGRCNDIINAAYIIQERNEIGKKIGLFGSSLGGAASLIAAKQLKPDALVTFAAPLRSGPVVKAVEESEEEDKKSNINLTQIQFDILQQVAGTKNILIFHGDSDKIVPPSDAHKLYSQAVMPKRLIMQKNGDHNMSLKENQDKFIREAVLWYKTELQERKHRLQL